MPDSDYRYRLNGFEPEDIDNIRALGPEKIRHLLGESPPPEHAGPQGDEPPPLWEYLDKKEAQPLDRKRITELAEAHREVKSSLKTQQQSATIRFNEERAIGIVLSADWHFGSAATDYKALEAHHDFILNSKHLYLVTVGDLIDNFINFRNVSAILGQVLPPNLQHAWLRALVKEYAERRKWLAAVWGNHDVEWDEKGLGFSRVAELLGERFVYFNEKGDLKITLFNTTYQFILAHYLAGKSIRDKNWSQKRAKQEYYPDADVIVSGHTHDPGYALDWRFGKVTHYVNVGAFKINDTYTMRNWSPGIVYTPVMVLHSGEKHIEIFQRPEAAEAYIDALN